MKKIVQYGLTSHREQIAIVSASTGLAITGLVYNSTSLAANYFRDGDTAVTAITLVTATVGTWTTSGFKEIGHGLYEIGIPNAVFANNVSSAIVVIDGYSGMAPVYLEFQIVPWNPQDSVRLGLTSLPNVSAGAAGGLPTATNGSGQITAVAGNVTGSVASVTGNVGGSVASVTGNVGGNVVGSVASVTAAVTVTPAPPTSSAIATAVAAAILITPSHLLATDASGNVSIAGSFPTVAAIAAAILATPANLLVTNASGQVVASSVVGAVGSVAGNVGGSLGGSVSGNVNGSVNSVTEPVELDLTLQIPLSNTAQSLGDALNAARAQGFGKWQITGTTLDLYAPDGATVVRSFTLDSATAPTTRS